MLGNASLRHLLRWLYETSPYFPKWLRIMTRFLITASLWSWDNHSAVFYYPFKCTVQFCLLVSCWFLCLHSNPRWPTIFCSNNDLYLDIKVFRRIQWTEKYPLFFGLWKNLQNTEEAGVSFFFYLCLFVCFVLRYSFTL